MREYEIIYREEELPDLYGRLFDPEDEDFCQDLNYASIDSYVWDATYYRPEARAYLTYDNGGLRVLMCAFEDTISAEVEDYGGAVYRDSCLEFFLQPFEDDPRYINIEVNPNGAALIGIGPDRFNRVRIEEEPEEMNIQSSRHKGGWWAIAYDLPKEMFMKLFGRIPMPGSTMRGNFYKCDETIHSHFGTWAPIMNFRPDFHLPQWFGELKLAARG